ncbi:MAG: hypothetical protein KF886_01005 [Candidatus Hydrogenedentes bacterium]|nr:hypothetical protein [Candidatus Hydrogenedentota bacterium]
MLHRMLLCPGLLFVAFAPAIAEDLPWWDRYPRIVQGTPEDLKPYQADVVFGGGLNAPSWGLWGQVLFGRPEAAGEVRRRGGRFITYFETFGQSYCVVVAVPDAQRNTEAPRASASHWGWRGSPGDPIYWAGAHTWFDDLPEARPWTRTHPAYGGPPMRYPDGREASGYAGDPANPLNHRAFDAGCSKNVLGDLSYEIEPMPDAIQENGPHEGLVQLGGQYTGLIYLHKDSACPHWLDLDEAAVRYAAERGANGMWSDNFSPWDSFGIRPVERGFGEWSVALFRGYLKEHFSAEALAAMGVADPDTFDVREALRAQVREWGGDDTDLRDRVWNDARWLDHDLWRAYVIFKRQRGTRALDAYDARMHAAAKASGEPEFLIAGNDIPGLSLGWVRGNLDLVSTESSAGYALDAGSRGLMLPPLGRHSVRYRLASAHARSRLVNIWPYLDGDLERYRRNPELTRIMAYEMLAAGALPMAYPSLPRVLGTPEAYADFFAFVGEAREHFGRRVPLARTGIYYSSSSLLAFMTPGGFVDFNRRPHQFGYYGWATALHDLHEPYVPVPEWRVTPETLSGLDRLIVPNAVVMAEEEIAVLRDWVDAGGTLLVTGDSGVRGGESENFARHDRGPMHTRISGPRVRHVAENVGMAYFLDHETRAAQLPAIREHLRAAYDAEHERIVVADGVPATVGVTPYIDPARGAFFVDVNNLAIDLEVDTVAPVAEIVFEVMLPEALRSGALTHRVLTPETDQSVGVTPVDGGRARVVIRGLRYYAAIMFTRR